MSSVAFGSRSRLGASLVPAILSAAVPWMQQMGHGLAVHPSFILQDPVPFLHRRGLPYTLSYKNGVGQWWIKEVGKRKTLIRAWRIVNAVVAAAVTA